MNLSPFHFAGLRHIHSPVNPSVLYTTVARQPPLSPAPAPLLSMSPHSSYPRVPSSFLPLQALRLAKCLPCGHKLGLMTVVVAIFPLTVRKFPRSKNKTPAAPPAPRGSSRAALCGTSYCGQGNICLVTTPGG